MPVAPLEPFPIISVSQLDDVPDSDSDIASVSTVDVYVQYLAPNLANIGAVVQYNVELLQSVRELKTAIEEIEGIPADEQDLRFFGFMQDPLKDYNTLQSCLIQKKSTVYLSLKPRTGGRCHLSARLKVRSGRNVELQDALHEYLSPAPCPPHSPYSSSIARRDWDGDMKHVWTDGLRVKTDTEFQVDTVSGDSSVPTDWHYGYTKSTSRSYGWIPRSFVRSCTAEIGDDDTTPSALPAFPFPPATHQTFQLRLGEKGHSYVNVSLTYKSISPPGEATRIDVRLDCVSAGDRKITSVSLKIIAPGSNVTTLKCPDTTTLGSLNSVIVESTSRRTWNHHGGINITIPHTPLGFDAGVARKIQHTQKEEGMRESGLTITGVHNVDTAHWIVEGRRGVGEREGVPKVLEGMSFVLEEKPSEFQYECFVTTTKGGREVEHWGQSVGLFAKLKKMVLQG
ncbi:hypothetical protein R3P38DRAFT_3299225, partial [Favolaschia claudopus]